MSPKENVAQVAQKVTRLLLEKVACMKCRARLRKVQDGLLNATKKLFLGKSLDTIAKQVYCYKLNVLVSFYIHLFFFLVMPLLKMLHVVTHFALNFMFAPSLWFIYHSWTSLLSVTLVENSRVKKKTNIIEKEALIKSRTEVESKKFGWRCCASDKTRSGFWWARLFLRVTFYAFKLLHVLLSSWKVRIIVILQIAFSQTQVS